MKIYEQEMGKGEISKSFSSILEYMNPVQKKGLGVPHLYNYQSLYLPQTSMYKNSSLIG